MKIPWRLVPFVVLVAALNFLRADSLPLDGFVPVAGYGWPFPAWEESPTSYTTAALFWNFTGLVVNLLSWFLILYAIHKSAFRFRLATGIIALLEGSILLGLLLKKDARWYWMSGWPYVYRYGDAINVSAIIKNVVFCAALVYLTAVGIEWVLNRRQVASV
jgi:hypothetical protein